MNLLGRIARKHRIAWLMLGIACVSGAHAYSLVGRARDANSWVTLGLWIGILVSAVGLLRAVEGRPERAGTTKPARTSPWWPVALIVVAFGLRIVWLERAPANVGGDESMQAVLAREFAEGDNDDIFGVSLWYDTPNFYYFVSSLPFLWVSDSVFWWRFQAVLIGTLTVYLLYVVGKRWFGFRVGLVAGALLAVDHVHIHFSRIGAHQLTDGLFAVLIPWLLTRAVDRQRASDAFIAGVVMAVSQHFYFGMRLLPLILLVILVYLAIVKGPSLWTWLKRFGPVTLLGIWTGSYPFVLSYQGSAESYLTRVRQVLVFDVNALLQRGILLPNKEMGFDLAERVRILITGLVAPQLKGWYEPGYGWLSALGLLLFWAGLFVILARLRSKPLQGLVLVMMGLPLLAVGLLTENPLTSQRLLIAVVWLPVIQALGLVWVWRFLEEQRPSSLRGRAFAGTVLVLLAVINLYRYFVIYTPERSYGFGNALRATEISKSVDNLEKGSQVALLGGDQVRVRGFANFRYLNRDLDYSDHARADVKFWQGAGDYDVVVAILDEEEAFEAYVRRYGDPGGEVVEAYYRPSRALPALIRYYVGDDPIVGGDYAVYPATEWTAPPDRNHLLFYMYWAHGFHP
ncbi:MAG: glycosyltransferase family 39 protein [Anaerolineae bacterium]